MRYYDPKTGRTSHGTSQATLPFDAATIDAGLRAYMLRGYNYMAGGLVLTGIVAYAAASSGFLPKHRRYAAHLDCHAGAAGLRDSLELRYSGITARTAAVLFWSYAAVMGLSLGSIFVVFTGASIARVFFITAATYGAMSLYGYTTRSDLSRFGSFLLMGLIGIVIASIVNIFVASSALQFTISVVGVIVFVGLTAYDTQRIKELYLESDTDEVESKKAILGALSLYLDFINLFMTLLQLFGQRRQE